ncbi:hypothetical protein T484DRAFT_1824730 [Baffinella frigidus]|nr:hypothetical protein T484DRAFT_1824730 [Cryptophyta sp. CCMP2293]
MKGNAQADAKVYAVAYEPTRGIGHAMAQYFGVVPAPSVSVTEVAANDVIVVGSDGLWSAMGSRRAPSDTGPSATEMEGEIFASFRSFMSIHRNRDAQTIATELMNTARTRGLRDNIAFAVLKMDAVGAPPGLQQQSAQGAQQASAQPASAPASSSASSAFQRPFDTVAYEGFVGPAFQGDTSSRGGRRGSNSSSSSRRREEGRARHTRNLPSRRG